MKEKLFDVTLYYSGFCSHTVSAKTEDDAIKKARKLFGDHDVPMEVEPMHECDTATEE